MKNYKKILLIALKLLFLSGIIIWILHRVNTQEILALLQQQQSITLVTALGLMVAAQIITALRMRYYFARNGATLNRKQACALYFSGLFFNHFLPGGISGDGYKIYMMGKYSQLTYMQSFTTLLSDRANGLYAICLLILAASTAFLAFYISLLFAIALTVTYLFSIHLLLKEPYQIAFRASAYSLSAQIIMLFVFLLLLHDLLPVLTVTTAASYGLVFMIANIISILPISIGGAGLRELTFLQSAAFFAISPELGVVLSLTFFILLLLCSLIGVPYILSTTSNYLTNHGRT